jgi:hypothetical protein
MTNKKIARTAGILYLGVVLTGLFSLMYVPSTLIAWDNPAITFQHITKHERLFRLGIVSGLACYTFFALLPLVLYRLFKPVHTGYAACMVVLALVSVPISFMNMQHKLAALSLVTDTTTPRIFTAEQLQAQMMFYLNQYDHGIMIVQIFWGLWLAPFGYLIFKSGLLPKVLGILLLLGCLSYLVNFAGQFLIPGYAAMGVSSFVSLPAGIGEIGNCLWLLTAGAKEYPAVVPSTIPVS